LSLEGRKFWILGLLPLRRETVLWGKFTFSVLGGLGLAEFLVVLSDVMLGIPLLGFLLHVLTVAVLALGLSGLSVGLGACLPNFRETDPSKIAAGFGGTLNLVGGLIFVLITISLMAIPWHVSAALDPTAWVAPSIEVMVVILGLATLGLLLMGALVVLLLRAGTRQLRRMEF
jgi:ABC-2 type transport system permease protein